MIVSASYRTDIPAFYVDWFLRRVQAGTVQYRNPFGGGLIDLSLERDAVDGIVFWTRNFRPLLDRLDPVLDRGWPFIVQFTITGYPRLLEPSVIPEAEALSQVGEIAARFGARAVVWRYDPILLSSVTDADWHRKTFRRLALALRGQVDEVVVSYVEPYRKTKRNLDRLTGTGRFEWELPPATEKLSLLQDLAAIADAADMTLNLCTQPDLIERSEGALSAARCIDVRRLSDVAGRPLEAKAKGNRPGCLCAESRDIGAYDTCPHGCAYCYAVVERDKAKAVYGAQDPAAPRLGR